MTNPQNPSKPLLDIFVDSLIVAAIALFSTPGQLDSYVFWLTGAKAFGLALVTQLVIERGIKYGTATN